MRHKKVIYHSLFTIGFCALLFFGSFVGFFTFHFGGYALPSLLPITLPICYVWIWKMYANPENKKSWWPWGISVVLTLGYFSYIYKVEQDREALRNVPSVVEFSKYDYRAFDQGSLVATLDEPSTLSLQDNLPILDGSTALYPMYSAFVQAVYPEHVAGLGELEKVITSSKTGNAYQRLLDGEVDLIFVPAPSKKQQEAAKAKKVDFKLTPIGKEAFVFFVNQQNPVEHLTVEQIQGIYSGKIRSWQELGGKEEKILAYQRPEGSGSQTALQRIMGDIPLIPALEEEVLEGMGGIIQKVANYRNFNNAIGFSFLLYSTKLVKANEIKLLAINGIYPNREHILDGSYPFSGEIYAVTLGNESPETQQLIKWIVGKQGQKLIEKTGYVPLYTE